MTALLSLFDGRCCHIGSAAAAAAVAAAAAAAAAVVVIVFSLQDAASGSQDAASGGGKARSHTARPRSEGSQPHSTAAFGASGWHTQALRVPLHALRRSSRRMGLGWDWAGLQGWPGLGGECVGAGSVEGWVGLNFPTRRRLPHHLGDAQRKLG